MKRIEVIKKKHGEKVNEAWNIGGPDIYKLQWNQQKNLKGCRIYLTRIQNKFDCNIFFHKQNFEDMTEISESEIQEENGIKYIFQVYEYKR